ncbi:MAG: MFS transporter [Deltaproteobacteria bacterium]|nr:MFS transporter [Deltaproteobacteria bacterium]
MSPLQTYLVARFLTTMAYQIEALAVGWQVYAFRKNPLDLGWVGLVQFIPMLALSLIGGQVADRFDRKKILTLAYLSWILTVVLMAIATGTGKVQLELLLSLLFIQGIIRAFSNPAAHAFVTQVVPDTDLKKAVALGASVWQVSTIFGPLVGGLLYGAFGGATWVYAICGLCSFSGILLLFKVKEFKNEPIKEKFNFKELFSGVRYVWNKRVLLGCISLDLFAVLFGGATALLPAYAADILHIGPSGLGILRAAPALGAIGTSLFLAKYPIKERAGFWLFTHVTLFGLATVGFGLSRGVMLSFLFLFITGATDMVSVVIRMTLVQTATPAYLRGRVSSVNSIFISASNELGEFESGITASWFGVIPAVVIGGIGSILVAGIWAWRFPELRKMQE